MLYSIIKISQCDMKRKGCEYHFTKVGTNCFNVPELKIWKDINKCFKKSEQINKDYISLKCECRCEVRDAI